MNAANLTGAVVAAASGLFLPERKEPLRDALVVFGVLVAAGAALGGVSKSDGIGRGLFWGAGGLAAAYGIDKAMVQR